MENYKIEKKNWKYEKVGTFRLFFFNRVILFTIYLLGFICFIELI